MIKIRNGNPGDIPKLLKITKEVQAESPRYSRLRRSEDKMILLFDRLMNMDEGLLIVADRDGEVVGGMMAIVVEHWTSYDLVSSDLVLFLQKDARGGSTAVKLVHEYIEWAKEQGAKMIQLGISTGINDDKTADLYRSMGLKQCLIGFEV